MKLQMRHQRHPFTDKLLNDGEIVYMMHTENDVQLKFDDESEVNDAQIIQYLSLSLSYW